MTASVFESFNARSLSPSQVASTFVPSKQYEILAKRNHSIVVGPRGSGKTTLLKMLQQPALESWQHARADEFREDIDFTGIFVGTDISWKEQLNSLGEGYLDDNTHRLLVTAAFTTHALRSLAQSLIDRCDTKILSGSKPFRRIGLERGLESQIVGAISQHWYLTPSIPTFLALRQSLTARLLDIKSLASTEQLLGTEGRAPRLSEIKYLHLDFISAASLAIEVFGDFSELREEKWAFLFDELELAPEWIRERLFQYIRSTDPRFLFKLALSPSNPDFSLVDDPSAPGVGNDYDQIPLWYAEKNDGYGFCKDLWYSMLAERDIPMQPPENILGRSEFEAPPVEYNSRRSAYRPSTHWGKLFAELSKRDKSFMNYLMRFGIDPFRLDQVTGVERAAKLRKVAHLVPIREFYRSEYQKEGSGDPISRSRKSAKIYAGAPSIFAVTEGNPRWFIALMDRLLSNVTSADAKVSPEAQGKEMVRISQRFQAMIRTIPIASQKPEYQRGLLGLVRRVGEFFYHQAVIADFVPEPPGTFTVDSDSDPDLVEAVRKALNAGAIIYVPYESERLILTNIKGKRFRLSYLFAPSYGIPLRLGPEISLGTILRSGNSSGRQLDLIEE